MSLPADLALVVGLGNPGQRYTATRHNAGVWWLQAWSQRLNPTAWRTESALGMHTSSVCLSGQKLRLGIPTTYMNESGRSVQAFMHYHRLLPTQLLVAHDELDLEPGDLRLKWGGGHAGHNGLRSIIQHLGSRDFFRLRIGIGHPGHKDQVSDHVLSPPRQEEQRRIDDAITGHLDLEALFKARN